MENKIKIYNQLENRPGVGAPVGTGKEAVMDYVKDPETGEVVYKKVGETNLYDIIQASKDSTDIHFIVDRVNKGEISLPDFQKGLFMDTSSLPKDINEANDMTKSINAIYEKDPLLKELYSSADEYQKAFVEGKVLDAYVELSNRKLKALKEEAEKKEKNVVNEEQQESEK